LKIGAGFIALDIDIVFLLTSTKGEFPLGGINYFF
jgi:hypothetical protein